MPKPPRRMEAQAENIEQTADSILPPTFASPQDLIQRSPHSHQTQQERSPYPPPHLEKATLLDWNREDSLKLDLWEWYCQQEFEAVGGWQ